MGVVHKAYRFRMYPNLSQKTLFSKTFGCVRLVYNHYLDQKKEIYEQTKKSLSYSQCAADLVSLKKEKTFLKEVDSICLQQALRHLDMAFSNFFRDSKVGYPRFKSKKNHRESYSTICVNGNIRLEGSHLVLPKVGRVRIRRHRVIPETWLLKSVTVIREATGKYFASILYEHITDENQSCDICREEDFLGIDYAMSGMAVLSDGTRLSYPGYFRKAEEHLAREQRKLSRCQKGSKNWEKQRNRVARCHEQVRNQRKDFHHKMSYRLSERYGCIVVEDLDMKAMSQSSELKLGKGVMDNGFGMFQALLSYKLADRGKHLIKIDRYFPSSKTCSCCGQVKERLSIAERIYRCECGNVMDRDVNAAINIREEGKRLFRREVQKNKDKGNDLSKRA